MRKMQVPAYWPVASGIHEKEKRGVFVAVKKVMAMLFMDMKSEGDVPFPMPIIMPMDIPPIELLVEGMAIPDIVLVGASDMDVAMFMLEEPISIL